jgi:hypothetical protein
MAGAGSTRWCWVGRALSNRRKHLGVSPPSSNRVNLKDRLSIKGTARAKREDTGNVPLGAVKGGAALFAKTTGNCRFP